MANQNLTLPVALRGGGAPVVTSLPFGANSWQHIDMRLNSADWNTIDGLWLAYSARVTTDGGTTWTSWGGTGSFSPTFMKDGVTKIGLGGHWDWSPAFAAGGSIEVTVDCPVAFNWGVTLTLSDS